MIALQDRGRGLNRRAEVLTRCWHKDQHLLANWVRSANVQGGQVPGLAGGGVLVDADGSAEGDNGDPVIEELEELPDEGQDTVSEGLSTTEEPPDIIGPVTRSRTKCLQANC